MGAVTTVVFATVVLVNLPTWIGITRGGWGPADPALSQFVAYVRRLPADARIVMFSPAQVPIAMTGRSIDFDFSPVREDSYLPPQARARVKAFWSGVAAGDAGALAALERRYDDAIAPLGSPSSVILARIFPDRRIVGDYAVYAMP